MRKVNPSDVRQDFADHVDSLTGFMDRTARVIAGGSTPKGDISRLASMVFLSLYVGFERLLSDLFLAYLNRDFSQYQVTLAARIRQSAEEKRGVWAASRMRFDPVQHIKVEDLESVVDRDGWNLTFKSAGDVKQKAADWLAPVHSNRIRRLTQHDERLIDTARAVRDFIAHQSSGSKQTMNDKLGTVTSGPHNRYLARGAHDVHNVGSYLKAVFVGQRRVEIYAGRLKEIAGRC